MCARKVEFFVPLVGGFGLHLGSWDLCLILALCDKQEHPYFGTVQWHFATATYIAQCALTFCKC